MAGASGDTRETVGGDRLPARGPASPERRLGAQSETPNAGRRSRAQTSTGTPSELSSRCSLADRRQDQGGHPPGPPVRPLDLLAPRELIARAATLAQSSVCLADETALERAVSSRRSNHLRVR